MKKTRITAAAALAAAALAITPAVASATVNQQTCREARISTANAIMDYALEFAAVGNWDMYWTMYNQYHYGMNNVGLC